MALELGIKLDDISTERMEKFARKYSFKFAENTVGNSVEKLQEVIGDSVSEGLTINETRQRVNDTFDQWSRDRAEAISRSETIRSTNRGTEAAYDDAGIKVKLWLAASDPCEFCANVDGRSANVGGNFFDLGDSVRGVEGGILKLDYTAIKSPPLHPNCRCTIIADMKS